MFQPIRKSLYLLLLPMAAIVLVICMETETVAHKYVVTFSLLFGDFYPKMIIHPAVVQY